MMSIVEVAMKGVVGKLTLEGQQLNRNFAILSSTYNDIGAKYQIIEGHFYGLFTYALHDLLNLF